jgi:hypothetical protein
VLIPALFSVMNDIRMLIYKLKNGVWPTREEVEPATQIDTEMLKDAAEMGK